MGHSSLHLHFGSVMVRPTQEELKPERAGFTTRPVWILGNPGRLFGLDVSWIWSTNPLCLFVNKTDGLLFTGSSGFPFFQVWTAAFCQWRWLNSLAFVYYAWLVHDLQTSTWKQTWRKPQSVKQEASDNEALYSSLLSVTSVPSHWFSLQWFIHKELHCFIAGRCEVDIILLYQVAMIFAVRDFIVLCCIVWAQQVSIKIDSVKTQTPFYAVVCAPLHHHLHLHHHSDFLITCLSRFNSRLKLGSRVLVSTLPV